MVMSYYFEKEGEFYGKETLREILHRVFGDIGEF